MCIMAPLGQIFRFAGSVHWRAQSALSLLFAAGEGRTARRCGVPGVQRRLGGGDFAGQLPVLP